MYGRFGRVGYGRTPQNRLETKLRGFLRWFGDPVRANMGTGGAGRVEGSVPTVPAG